MTFKDFEYTRPEMDQLISSADTIIDQFSAAGSVVEQNELIAKLNVLRNDFDTMWNIAQIRHTIDTTDKFYEAENSFYDQNLPLFQSIVSKFYKALVGSTFRKELEGEWGEQFFKIAEMTTRTFDESIIEHLKTENSLVSKYVKLLSSANIEFMDKEYNLSGLVPFMQNQDREIRKGSSNAYWSFFAENKDKLDELFGQLVKIRSEIADKLGFNNFVELGYLRMLRSDYNSEDVKRFRGLVKKHIVPITAQLKKRQTNRLGLDSLKYYDNGINFSNGNAKPKGDPEWILAHGRKMYEELSPETAEFFEFMVEKQLLDLVNKKGKAGGGYCTYLPNQKAPFIFSNFNGTSHDIDVLTHEAGHAFQVYQSRNFEIPEYNWPTYEACEIHSMSMEFLTWPWMDRFFEDEVDKYRFTHLSGGLNFLPYGVSVDEFQHFVYENPEATPAERNAAWSAIEAKYLPHLDYDGNEFLEGGGFWQKQAHIFESPFYYIDYTLAQICAFQFWKRSQDDRKSALADYMRLCAAGGSKSFLQLVDYANLESPFEEAAFNKVVGSVEQYLEAVDDTAL
ncbi:M3 family oligoendopeptidase [Chitinophagales bacterium]|nr:M3 family oligoendopeptidase [Chitinophagales bacterium]